MVKTRAAFTTGAVVACASALLGACGGSADDEPTESAKNFEGQQRGVAETVERLEKAVRDGDIEAYCHDVLSRTVVAQADRGGQRCSDQKAVLRDEVKRYGGKDRYDIAVNKVRVDGKRAVASVTYSGSGKKKQDTIDLLKEDGQWGIGAQAGD